MLLINLRIPSIDKIYLYENFSRQKNLELKKRIKKAKKRLKAKNINYKAFKYRKFESKKLKTFETSFIKRWFISFLSVVSRKGSLSKYNNYLLFVFKKLSLNYNLFWFFFKIEQNLFINFENFKKKIAGRNFLIPLGLDPYKRVNAIVKLIISNLKSRKERLFIDKLYNELLDVFNNKGLSVGKRLQYTKQLKDNLTNIRFLNEKYI